MDVDNSPRSFLQRTIKSSLHQELQAIVKKLENADDQCWNDGTCMLEEECRKTVNQFYMRKDWTQEEAKLASALIGNLLRRESPLCNHDLFLSLINAFAKSHLCHEAENVLDYMTHLAVTTEREDMEPNRVAINTVIGAWAKSGVDGGAEKAKELLKRLEEEYRETKNERLKPNSRSYGKVIDAYAREEKPDIAGAILHHMEYNYRSKVTDIPPTVQCFSSVVDAYARVQARCAPVGFAKVNRRNRRYSNPVRDLPDRAEKVLRGLLDFYRDYKLSAAKPDVQIFTTVINVWSKSGRTERVDRVRDLVKTMKEYQVEGDLYLYNVFLNVLASAATWETIREAEKVLTFLEDHESLQPDDYTYNSILKAYVTLAAADDAERLLYRWQQMCLEQKAVSMPDSYSYASVIDCWAKTRGQGSAANATDVLFWMQRHNIEASIYCYNNVLKAWACSTSLDRLERFEEIWKCMPEKDQVSHCCKINIYARTNRFSDSCQAETYMRQFVETQRLRLDTIICSSVLASYGRCGDPSAGEQAENLAEWMGQYLRLDVICYNSILQAFGGNADKAMEFFRKKMPVEPTTVTYQILVDICKDRDDFLMELFQDCINNKMLDDRLISTFRRHGPDIVVNQLSTANIREKWGNLADRGPKRGCSRKKFIVQSNQRVVSRPGFHCGW